MDQQPADRPRLAGRDFVMLLVQLCLLCTLVWQFHLDEGHYLLACLIAVTAGFAVHAWLPFQAGLQWFLLLSAGCLVLVLGWTEAACAAGIAIALIGIAWLPLDVRLRALLLLGCGAGLFLMRGESDRMFWPIVGSMFMFRLLIYVVESRRFRTRPSLLMTASYFLMLPNIFYPLFPIVDFRTFCNTACTGERRNVYQTGVHWMFLGVAQLLLYRFIKTEVLPAPYEVRTTRDVAMFLAMNYALYVRISGQFHLVCGVLHMFGFNLPRTHDNYFLASSFTDIWRRINIYWKDFLSSFVFVPTYFRLRKLGESAGIALSVLCVFVATWVGHSWQAFWLKGVFPLRTQDAAAWLLIGGLVAVNAVINYKLTSLHRPAPRMSPLIAMTHALKILGVFTCVSLFWAYWASPEILKYLLDTVRAAGIQRADVFWIGGVVAVFLIVAVLVQMLLARRSPTAKAGSQAPLVNLERMDFDRSVAFHLLPALALLVLLIEPVAMSLGPRAARLIADLRVERTTAGDAMAMIDGYYEQLNAPTSQASPFLGQIRRAPPSRFADEFVAMTRPRSDIRGLELIPGWQGEFDGALTTVNRWGMRDRARSLQKPPGTVRIAMVGSSIVMGLGVDDEHTFSRLLEDQLNARGDGVTYEVLNFGVGKSYAVERRAMIEQKVLQFDPDLILYFAHQDELFRVTTTLGNAYRAGRSYDDPALDEIFREAGLHREMSEYAMEAIMARSLVPVLQQTYRRMAEICREADVKLVLVYLPIPGEHQIPSDPAVVLGMARDAGIETIDLSGWWKEFTAKDVVGVVDQYHPRELGTRLIAERLGSELERRPELLQPQAGRGSDR